MNINVPGGQSEKLYKALNFAVKSYCLESELLIKFSTVATILFSISCLRNHVTKQAFQYIIFFAGRAIVTYNRSLSNGALTTFSHLQTTYHFTVFKFSYFFIKLLRQQNVKEYLGQLQSVTASPVDIILFFFRDSTFLLRELHTLFTFQTDYIRQYLKVIKNKYPSVLNYCLYATIYSYFDTLLTLRVQVTMHVTNVYFRAGKKHNNVYIICSTKVQ